MAVLSDADRLACSAKIQTHPEIGRFGNVLKSDILAMVNALDDFANANAAAINNAIPPIPRANCTTVQKAIGFMTVIQMRYLRGS